MAVLVLRGQVVDPGALNVQLQVVHIVVHQLPRLADARRGGPGLGHVRAAVEKVPAHGRHRVKAVDPAVIGAAPVGIGGSDLGVERGVEGGFGQLAVGLGGADVLKVGGQFGVVLFRQLKDGIRPGEGLGRHGYGLHARHGRHARQAGIGVFGHEQRGLGLRKAGQGARQAGLRLAHVGLGVGAEIGAVLGLPEDGAVLGHVALRQGVDGAAAQEIDMGDDAVQRERRGRIEHAGLDRVQRGFGVAHARARGEAVPDGLGEPRADLAHAVHLLVQIAVAGGAVAQEAAAGLALHVHAGTEPGAGAAQLVLQHLPVLLHALERPMVAQDAVDGVRNRHGLARRWRRRPGSPALLGAERGRHKTACQKNARERCDDSTLCSDFHTILHHFAQPRLNAAMPVPSRPPHLPTATAWPRPRFPGLSATHETRPGASFNSATFGVYVAKIYMARMFPSNDFFQDG